MKGFIESQNYDLTKKEENDSIEKINNLLKDYEKLLKLDFDDMNQRKILRASKISELMLSLLLKKEGYLFKNRTPFSCMINFSKNQKIIPQECSMFLQIIIKYQNGTVHGNYPTIELTQAFLNAFMYYISWFNNNYSSKYQIKNPFRIEKCCARIKFLENFNKNKKTLKIEGNGIPKGNLPTVEGRRQRDTYDDSKKTVCPECGSEELIGDYERAEVVCAHCGLIIDENLVDMGPEWKAFDHEQRDKRTRVGAPITYTIHDKSQSTMIDWKNKDIYCRDILARNRAQWYRSKKSQQKIRISGATERNLAFAISELDRNSSRLGLPRSVKETASVIYRSGMDNKLIMGRSIESLVAASLYAACRRYNVPRTLDEIAEVSHLTKKEVGRTYRFLTRELNIKLPPTSPVDYVPRFASELGLSVEVESKAIEIIEKAMEKGLTSGRSPTGVAATALYIASISLGERISQRDIADIAGVTKVTIHNRYKELIEELEISTTLPYDKFPSKNDKKEKLILKSDTHLKKDNQDKILEELRKQNEALKQILKTVLETKEITKSINEKINIITKRLDGIQSHTEKLINNALSEEEIDRIIQVHTTEYIENILEYSHDINENEQYNEEEIKLIDSFEENAWNKLSKDSQNFLITSKFMYNKFITSKNIIDYSGICVLVTKALEVEIFNRFFTNFIRYLDETYQKNYSKYHTALLFQNKTPLYPERFTMGNIAFVLCYKEDYFDSDEQKENNKSKLIEYCKKHVFSKYTNEEIEELLDSYAKDIENIRINYRNPSAHRNKIGKVNAKECFDLVIDVEKLLKKMLDSFDI